jgi:DNA-binding SARP family transcriptional activator
MWSSTTRVRAGQMNPESESPVLIGLLGQFRVLKAGQPVSVRGKAGQLLARLAIRAEQGIVREKLLSDIWPDQDPSLASASLNTLVWSLRQRLGDALGGAAPVVSRGGCYLINMPAGVTADTHWFDALASAGDEQVREGAPAAARLRYMRAVDLYRGDLCLDTDADAIVERERLSVRFQDLLVWLGEYEFMRGEVASSLMLAQKLLASDPCREDGHRLVMRCHVRRGERVLALRQYRICEALLRKEFDTRPESATRALFDRVRADPDSIRGAADPDVRET